MTTITLEDVHFILDLPTSGHSVLFSVGTRLVEELRRLIHELLGTLPDRYVFGNGGMKI